MLPIAHIGKGYWPRVRVGKKYAVVLIAQSFYLVHTQQILTKEL